MKAPLWLREIGHVGVWFIVAETCQYFALGLFPEWAGYFAVLFAMLALLAVTVYLEYREYRYYGQAKLKTAWDIVAKGIVGIGLATAFPALWESI